MKIFMSSLNAAILFHLYKIFPDRKVNVLRSFGVISGDDHLFISKKIPNIGDLMYDSGTYTINLLGANRN